MKIAWNSSPIRESSYPETAEERQKARAQRLYRPMSSPVQRRTTRSEPGQNPTRERAKLEAKEKREDERQKRLDLSREKITDIETAAKHERELLRQAAREELYVELLIGEEESKKLEEQLSMKAIEQQFLEELEALLAQEQAELELHFEDMRI